MAKKIKIPPISPERRAIFEANNEDESSINTLHASLYLHDIAKIKKRAASIPVKWVDLEVTGNEIIKDYYRIRAETRRLLAEKAFARDKWSDYFYHIFRRPLKPFMEAWTGLDVCKLDKEVIKPPDGTSTYDYVREKHGPLAVTMLNELISGIPDRQQRVEIPDGI